jgi:hypothetical protein
MWVGNRFFFHKTLIRALPLIQIFNAPEHLPYFEIKMLGAHIVKQSP